MFYWQMNKRVALHRSRPPADQSGKREDVRRVGRVGEDVTRMLRGNCFRGIPVTHRVLQNFSRFYCARKASVWWPSVRLSVFSVLRIVELTGQGAAPLALSNHVYSNLLTRWRHMTRQAHVSFRGIKAEYSCCRPVCSGVRWGGRFGEHWGEIWGDQTPTMPIRNKICVSHVVA